MGAGGLRFDYRAGQIGRSVVNGSPPLRCFFGAVLPEAETLCPGDKPGLLLLALAQYNEYNEDLIKVFPAVRVGAKAVDLGGPRVYQGGPKFENKHKSRCLQKRKLVIGGARPPGPP